MKKTQFSLLYPVIKEKLNCGGQVELPVSGRSMLPLLREETDSVILTSVNTISKNDIVLYKRTDDTFVLHRVIKIKNGKYSILGDNQFHSDKNISFDQICAVMIAFKRNSQRIELGTKSYKIYCTALPLRRIKNALKYYLKRAVGLKG